MYCSHGVALFISAVVWLLCRRKVLINITGTQANPVQGITLSGLTFRDSAYTYLEPHGLPSGARACVSFLLLFPTFFCCEAPTCVCKSVFAFAGGDWALARTGAVFLQGTENVQILDSLFTRLDGQGLMVSGYNRGLIVSRNEVRKPLARVYLLV